MKIVLLVAGIVAATVGLATVLVFVLAPVLIFVLAPLLEPHRQVRNTSALDKWFDLGLSSVRVDQPVRRDGVVTIPISVANNSDRVFQPIEDIDILDENAQPVSWFSVGGVSDLCRNIRPNTYITGEVRATLEGEKFFIQIEYFKQLDNYGDREVFERELQIVDAPALPTKRQESDSKTIPLSKAAEPIAQTNEHIEHPVAQKEPAAVREPSRPTGDEAWPPPLKPSDRPESVESSEYEFIFDTTDQIAAKKKKLEEDKREKRPFRTWFSSNGQFSVEAVIEYRSGKEISLIKRDGAKIKVQLASLSDADQAYAKGTQWAKLPLPAMD